MWKINKFVRCSNVKTLIMKFKIGLLGIVALAVAACGGVKKDNRVTVIDGFAQGGTYHIVI